MSPTLVLGIGNVLMGDEGIGVHAVQALERDTWPAGVTLVDGGTGGFHLLEYLHDFPAIVLIDATMDGQPAGAVSVLRPKYASDFPRVLTAHDIGLRDLIEATVLTRPMPDITLITVSIETIQSMVLTLSPAVEGSIPLVRQLVKKLLHEEREVAHA
jgi:hydrogenase maturation protease